MKKKFIFIITGIFVLILISYLFIINSVEKESFENNIKSPLIKIQGISDYGLIEIKNNISKEKVITLELKENTEICLRLKGCSASTEIIMYKDGKLIDEVRFMDEEKINSVSIKSYNLYIKEGEKEIPYNYEEVEGNSKGIKYNLILKGKLNKFQRVDWQIKSAGTNWIEDWATWSDSLTNGTIAYWKFDETSGTNAEDWTGNYDLTTNSSNWTDGIINNALDFNATGYQAYNDTFLDKNMTDVSFSFWFKPNEWYNSTRTVTQEIFSKQDDLDSKRLEVYLRATDGKLVVVSTTSTTTLSNESHWEAGVWYHAVVVWSATNDNITLWVDGEFNHSSAQTNTLNTTILEKDFLIGMNPAYGYYYNGSIDEFGVWNRTLTVQEITDLYNSGAGLSTEGLVTLNYPEDNYNTTNKIINFNCTASTSSVLNISNISLYHNETETWTLNQTNSTTHEKNSTSIFTVEFQNYGSIEWNCYACTNDSSCEYGDNRTLNIKRLVINEENYSQITTEGNVEAFYINISTASLNINSANLTYNSTDYTASFTQEGYNFSISKSINIPQITSSKNFTFNWSFEFADASTFSTTSHNQSVLSLNIDNCSTYTNLFFNISLKDEEDQTDLNESTQNTSIKLDFTVSSSDGTEMINYSAFFNLTNPAEVCLETPLNQSSLRLDGIIEYSSLNRFTEFYHFQNYSLDETTTGINISLYNLNSSNGQEFKITYKDSNFVPVEGAILDIQRKYIEEGLFKTTERPKTGTEGYTIGHLVINDIVYNIIVYKEGQLLASFNDIVADCQNPTLENCNINLNSYGSSIIPSSFAVVNDIAFTLIYDTDTREIDSVFSILSGATSTINLDVNLSDSLGSTNVCNDTLYASGGEVSCIVPLSFGNSTVTAKLYKNGDLVGQSIIRIAPDPSDIYGSSLIFIALFAFLLIIGIGISDNPMIMGVVLIMGIIVLTALNIIYTPSLVGVGATILWFVVSVIIILIKGSNRQ